MGWVVDNEGRGGWNFGGEEAQLLAGDDDLPLGRCWPLAAAFGGLAPRKPSPSFGGWAAEPCSVFVVPGSGTAAVRPRKVLLFLGALRNGYQMRSSNVFYRNEKKKKRIEHMLLPVLFEITGIQFPT